jgi:dihydropteroate synthase
VWFDPGLGFNKSAVHSLTLLARLSEFTDLEAPIVLGASRKSFISSLDNTPPQRRLGGSIAACITALNQGANVMRVHDVEETRQALRLTLVTQRRAEEAVRA